MKFKEVEVKVVDFMANNDIALFEGDGDGSGEEL